MIETTEEREVLIPLFPDPKDEFTTLLFQRAYIRELKNRNEELFQKVVELANEKSDVINQLEVSQNKLLDVQEEFTRYKEQLKTFNDLGGESTQIKNLKAQVRSLEAKLKAKSDLNKKLTNQILQNS